MFSKTQPPKPSAKATVTNTPGFSILGADTAIKGNVSADSDLHIDGRVTGDITCASLIQGETSEVIGNIKVESGRLAGIVRGTIDAGDLTILKSAEIHGDVHYDALTIEPGAKVEGRLAVRSAFLLEPSLEMEGAGEPLLTLASANA